MISQNLYESVETWKLSAFCYFSLIVSFQYNNPASPVDGYYVYYRATNNAGDYVKATVEGENTRSCNITHLLPDTSYDIKVQSFTIGSASDFSTIITRKTLGTCHNNSYFISTLDKKEMKI